MAAGFQMDTATVNSQIGADAQYMKEFYHWLKKRYATWNQNVTTNILEAAPLNFSAGDAATIMALVGDMNRLIMVYEGNNPGSFTAIANFDVNALLGCN